MASSEFTNINMELSNEDDTLRGRYLSFLMDNELYGMEIRNITEIIGIQPITVIPDMPIYVKGITNLRGSIIPVIDARLRFKKEEKEYDERTCIIVVEYKDLSIGLIVDSVAEVLTLYDENITPSTDINKNGQKHIKGMGIVDEKIILLLDCESLLVNEEEELEYVSS